MSVVAQEFIAIANSTAVITMAAAIVRVWDFVVPIVHWSILMVQLPCEAVELKLADSVAVQNFKMTDSLFFIFVPPYAKIFSLVKLPPFSNLN